MKISLKIEVEIISIFNPTIMTELNGAGQLWAYGCRNCPDRDEAAEEGVIFSCSKYLSGIVSKVRNQDMAGVFQKKPMLVGELKNQFESFIRRNALYCDINAIAGLRTSVEALMPEEYQP